MSTIEDIEWMARTGETLERAARRLKVKPMSLIRRLERRGRLDLRDRLVANGGYPESEAA